MSNFITATEAIDIAFEKKHFKEGYIKPSVIEIAEESFLRPVLGEELYDHLNQNDSGLNSVEIELKGALKKALAYYIKYEVMPDVTAQTTNKGIVSQSGQYSSTPTAAERADVRIKARENAHVLLDKAIRFIYENISSFPLYEQSKNSRNRIKRYGGLIF